MKMLMYGIAGILILFGSILIQALLPFSAIDVFVNNGLAIMAATLSWLGMVMVHE